MSQYYSRINIIVSSQQVWGRFKNEYDAGLDLASLERESITKSFVMDDEWSCTERELKNIVNRLSIRLGQDGIIIADTCDFNVDPYNYCVFYLGGRIRESYKKTKKCNMFHQTSIKNVTDWLKYGAFEFSDIEKKQLSKCGIRVNDNKPRKLKLLFDDVYLRETSFENRPDIIERISSDDELQLIISPDSYDRAKIEVTSQLGSLGYLPSDVGEVIAPLLNKDKLDYTVSITEVVPLSKRNKHAKSPIIVVCLEIEERANNIKG